MSDTPQETRRKTHFDEKLPELEAMLEPIIDRLSKRVLEALEKQRVKGASQKAKPAEAGAHWLGAKGDALSEAAKAADVELTPELVQAGLRILREPNAPVLGRCSAALYFDAALDLGFAEEIRQTHVDWRAKLDAIDANWRQWAGVSPDVRGALSLFDPGLRGAVSFSAEAGALSDPTRRR